MKCLTKFVLATLITGLFSFIAEGQVKSQREHVKSMKKGKYITYSVTVNTELKNERIFYSKASEKFPFEITNIDREPTFTKDARLTLHVGDKKHQFYMPDHFAFPATYAARAYEGNKKMQQEHGFVLRKFRRHSYNNEYIFLDGIGYQVNIDLQNSYIRVNYVFVPEDFAAKEEASKGGEKKKMSLKERMKALKDKMTDPGSKKLGEMKATDKVKAYIKAALAKQKEVIPQWEASKEGKDYLANTKRVNDAMNKIINAQNSMYIKNMTGKTIYVYIYDSYKATAVANGTTVKYACGMELYYDFDGDRLHFPGRVIQISRAGVFDKCADKTGGKPYEVK